MAIYDESFIDLLTWLTEPEKNLFRALYQVEGMVEELEGNSVDRSAYIEIYGFIDAATLTFLRRNPKAKPDDHEALRTRLTREESKVYQVLQKALEMVRALPLDKRGRVDPLYIRLKGFIEAAIYEFFRKYPSPEGLKLLDLKGNLIASVQGGELVPGKKRQH